MKIQNPEVAELQKAFIVEDEDGQLRSGIDKDGTVRVSAKLLMEVLHLAEGNFVGVAKMPIAQIERIIKRAEAGDQLAHEALVLEFHELLDNHIMPPIGLRAYVGRYDLIQLGLLNPI